MSGLTLSRRALAATGLACALVAGCGDPPPPAVAASSAGLREFSGAMTVTGSRQTMPLQERQSAAVFRLSGSALLSGTARPNLGFKVDIIGFSTSVTGMTGRSVWTDERGDRAFSELRAAEAGPGKPVDGTFTGGTGRYAGLTGNYRFTWQYLMDADDGNIGARVTDLRGTARLATAEPPTQEKP